MSYSYKLVHNTTLPVWDKDLPTWLVDNVFRALSITADWDEVLTHLKAAVADGVFVSGGEMILVGEDGLVWHVGFQQESDDDPTVTLQETSLIAAPAPLKPKSSELVSMADLKTHALEKVASYFEACISRGAQVDRSLLEYTSSLGDVPNSSALDMCVAYARKLRVMLSTVEVANLEFDGQSPRMARCGIYVYVDRANQPLGLYLESIGAVNDLVRHELSHGFQYDAKTRTISGRQNGEGDPVTLSFEGVTPEELAYLLRGFSMCVSYDEVRQGHMHTTR